MPRLYLVRHGKAAASWAAAADPGLDAEGAAQADAMAAELAPLGPLPLLVSPMRRARETAAALERRWSSAAAIDEAVTEVPSPTPDLAARGAWLRQVLQGTWDEAGPAVQAWRSRLLARLVAIAADTVVVTHFIAINALVAQSLGDRRVRVFDPDYCSCTVFDGPRLLRRGREMPTRVL